MAVEERHVSKTLAALATMSVLHTAALGVLLHRTSTLREVVDATPPWRVASDARIARIENRIDLLDDLVERVREGESRGQR